MPHINLPYDHDNACCPLGFLTDYFILLKNFDERVLLINYTIRNKMQSKKY